VTTNEKGDVRPSFMLLMFLPLLFCVCVCVLLFLTCNCTSQWTEQILLPEVFKTPKQVSGTLLSESYYLSESNQVLWGIRIRQERVKKTSVSTDCYLPKVIVESGIIGETDCTHEYNAEYKSMAGYGGRTTSNKPLYTYAQSMDGDKDGFIYDLVPLNKTTAERAVRAMKCDSDYPVDINSTTGGDLWHDDLVDRTKCIPFLDAQTSAVYVVLQVYNPNYNIFARMQMKIYFTVSGGIENSIEFNSATLDQSTTTFQAGTLVNVLLMIAMVVEMFFWVQELRHGAVQFFSFAAFVDMLIHVLSCIFIFDTVREWLNYTASIIVVDLRNIQTFTDLYDHLMHRERMNICQGLLILLLILRLFKYLKFIRGLQAVYRTIMSAGVDIAYFFVLFVAIMMAFVFAGYVVFGPATERFSTIPEAITTILRLVVLDFDYSVFEAAGTSGILYLFGSMFFFYFLLVNIFTAIVLSSWQTEKKLLDESNAKRIQTAPIRWKKGFYYFVCCGWLIDFCKLIRHPVQCGHRCTSYVKDSMSRMDSHEIMIRLEQWHVRKINQRTEFMNFDRIQQALTGGQGNRRDISPYQVQIVMKLCQTKRIGGEKIIYTQLEMQKYLAEAEQEMEDFSVGNHDALESVTALKKLSNAVSIVHSNQREYMKDAMVTLREIQDATMQAQNRLQSITSRVDGMIND